jgi:hypothetical protein
MTYWDLAFLEKPDGTWKLHYHEGGGNWIEIGSIPITDADNPYYKEPTK